MKIFLPYQMPKPFNGSAAFNAKLEVLMGEAIEAITAEIFTQLSDGEDFPLSRVEHHDACMKLCHKAFERLYRAEDYSAAASTGG